MYWINLYRTFHPNAAEYTVFSSAHGTFSRVDHMLGHKTSLSKFKKIEITSSIFSDHNGMKLETNYKKKSGKNHRYMETEQSATERLLDWWRNQRRSKKLPEDKLRWKDDIPKFIGCSKSGTKREVYSKTDLPQDTRKISNNLNLH